MLAELLASVFHRAAMGQDVSPHPLGSEDKSEEGDGGSGTAVEPAEPKKQSRPKADSKTKPKKPKRRQLPPWKVLLHNDDKNTFEHVIVTILELTPLNQLTAVKAAEEADKTGVSLLLVTHRERAELFVDQFQSKSLTVTIEPAE